MLKKAICFYNRKSASSSFNEGADEWITGMGFAGTPPTPPTRPATPRNKINSRKSQAAFGNEGRFYLETADADATPTASPPDKTVD